jgi:hypothetical protein
MSGATRRERNRCFKGGARLGNATELSKEPTQISVDHSVAGRKRNRPLVMCDGGLVPAALAQEDTEIEVRLRSFSGAGFTENDFAIKSLGLRKPADALPGLRAA